MTRLLPRCVEGLAVLVCFVAVLALGGCSNAEGVVSESERRIPTVLVESVGRADISEVLSYVADLQAYMEVTVFSPVPDRILDFPWEDGDLIRRGGRVALIRKEGLDKGLEQIEAQAEALDVQILNLKNELERSKGLLAAGVVTRQTFDKVQTSYYSTVAQRKALGASKEQLAVNAGNALITAPIGGVIAGKMLEVGDLAVPQVPLCRILAIDRLKVLLRLIEADVPKVRRGHEVVLHLDAYPNRTFGGKVTNIMPFLDAMTRTNTVEVVVNNPVDKESGQRLLKPGMFGMAELVLETREQVLSGPEPAFLLDNRILEKQKKGETLRKAFVVDKESIARQRLVRLGARKGSIYEILDGIEEGERLVVRGHHGLPDGQKVEVVSASGR